MRVLCEQQHTPEWFAAKRGRISASSAHIALMGRNTKGRVAYVAKLADDREGVPDFDEVDVKPWFVDGIFYESWARGWYEFKYDRDVVQTGFVVHDEYDWIGCSPDGLVGDDGLIEIKFRKWLRTYDEMARVQVIKRDVMAQTQTQLFVTGREWVDYVNYWRADEHEVEKGHVQRIWVDRPYLENTLLPAIVSLWSDVAAEIKQRELRRRTAVG